MGLRKTYTDILADWIPVRKKCVLAPECCGRPVTVCGDCGWQLPDPMYMTFTDIPTPPPAVFPFVNQSYVHSYIGDALVPPNSFYVPFGSALHAWAHGTVDLSGITFGVQPGPTRAALWYVHPLGSEFYFSSFMTSACVIDPIDGFGNPASVGVAVLWRWTIFNVEPGFNSIVSEGGFASLALPQTPGGITVPPGTPLNEVCGQVGNVTPWLDLNYVFETNNIGIDITD